MTLRHVVIIGSGHAGLQTAVSLRQGGFDGCIYMIGNEDCAPYQRPPLSKNFLKSGAGPETLTLRQPAFFTDSDIEGIWNDAATQISPRESRIRLSSGRQLTYDHLALATGAANRPLGLPGAECENVLSLRTVGDAIRIRESLNPGTRVVVVGGGFVGVELACTATEMGAHVVLLERAERLMPRAATPTASEHVLRLHRASGLGIRLGAALERLHVKDRRATGVEVAGGEILPCDLVLVGIGIAPNTRLAEEAGLAVSDGIEVDSGLRTSDHRISAVGDCARFPRRGHLGSLQRLESLQNATDQGKAVAAGLIGDAVLFDSLPWFWSDQGEAKIQIAGLAAPSDETLVLGDPEGHRLTVLSFLKGQLVAVESINSPAEHMAARKILSGGPPVSIEQARRPDFSLRELARKGAEGEVRVVRPEHADAQS